MVVGEQSRDGVVVPESAAVEARELTRRYGEGETAVDALRGATVRAELDGRSCVGMAQGVDDEGSLLVDTPAGRVTVTSGEVLRVRDTGAAW